MTIKQQQDQQLLEELQQDLEKFRRARAAARANGENVLFVELTKAIDRLEEAQRILRQRVED